jgi:hypothetical protein
MNQTPLLPLDRLLRNQSVALVGPAESLTGKRQGSEIDAFDVVVRLKFNDLHNEIDVGTRTDIVYFTPHQNAERFCWHLQQASVDIPVLVSTYPHDKSHTINFLKKLPSKCKVGYVSKYHRNFILNRMIGKPYTGITAMFHLLTHPIARLKIFGVDFYTTGYRDEYIAKVVKPINKVQKNTTKCVPDIVVFSKGSGKLCHDNISQFEFFRNYILGDRRVALDNNLSAIVKASDAAESPKQCRLLPRIRLKMFKLLLHLRSVFRKNKLSRSVSVSTTTGAVGWITGRL